MRRVSALVAVILALGACGGDDPELVAPERTTAPQRSGAMTTKLPSDQADDPAGTSESTGPYKAEGDYENGRHIGKVTSFESSTLGLDVVEFLTGDEAKEAYAQETGDSAGPPNDYYVQNQSKTVRLLGISDRVVIRVNTTGGYPPSEPNQGRRVSQRTFAAYFSDGPLEGLFWITIKDGDVVAVEEQYLP